MAREVLPLRTWTDNVQRVSFTVPVHLSLMNLADVVTAGPLWLDWIETGSDFHTSLWDDGARVLAANPLFVKMIERKLTSRQQVIRLAQEALVNDTAEQAGCRVGDENIEPLRDVVLARLEALWA